MKCKQSEGGDTIGIDTRNFYAFIVVLGISILVTSSTVYKFGDNIIVAIITTSFCSILILYGIYNWSKMQNKEQRILDLEIQRKDATLDFDIRDIEAWNDLDWIPEGISLDEKGQPTADDFEPHEYSTYTIKIDVFNNCLINNWVRDISVDIIAGEKDIKCDEIKANLPIEILERNHSPLTIDAKKYDYNGRDKDVVKVILKTMDNKVVEKTFEIKKYNNSPEVE